MIMSSNCSLLCSLEFWTLKYPGLHERDIAVHSYQQKPPPPVKQSILSFMHSASSASSNTDKTPKKATYYDEYNDYFASRSLPFHLSNKLFHNLRDKLTEFDELLSSLKLVRTSWLRPDTIWLAFANGTFVFVYTDKMNRTLKNISIDRTSLVKKFNVTATISDMYINSFGLYILYENLSKVDILRFATPIRLFDTKFNLYNEVSRVTSEELPPYSNTLPIRRWMNVNHEHKTMTIWWSTLAEGIPTSGHIVDGDQRKSRFNCFSIVFPTHNIGDKEKMYSIQTETSNPYFCSSTPSGLTTVEMNEHTDKTSSKRTYELSIYYYENFRSVPLRLVHIPLLSASISYVIRSSSHTVLCLTDSTLVCIDEINHVQRSKLCALTRNITGLWWIVDNLLFGIADEYGALIFYDIALNPIWPVLSSSQKLNFHRLLNMDKAIVAMEQPFIPISSSNITMLLQFTQGGPIGLLDLHLPLVNVHSLEQFYLKCQNYIYAIDLLWCLDWTRQDTDCRLAMSFIAQQLLRDTKDEQIDFEHMEQVLRTFYAPLRPISDASILRNRTFVTQLATRFFYRLLHARSYSKALQLAKHLEIRSIYLDLYYACDHANEKTIMNVCALKLKSQSVIGENEMGNDDEEEEEESDLSVTSSEDEIQTETTVPPRISSPPSYGNINEILTSAIEHYKLDETMYKFLSARIHAP